MTNKFGLVIRDGLENDINACMKLDVTYETDYVWQMSIRRDTDQQQVLFKEEHLPRTLEASYPADAERLRNALKAKHCFLVAANRDSSDILGYLTMRHDTGHGLAIIQDIVVSRPFRRYKIGSRLLKVARKWAMEHGLSALQVETRSKNHPAILFCQYSGLNFCGFNDQYFKNQDIAVFFGQSLR